MSIPDTVVFGPKTNSLAEVLFSQCHADSLDTLKGLLLSPPSLNGVPVVTVAAGVTELGPLDGLRLCLHCADSRLTVSVRTNRDQISFDDILQLHTPLQFSLLY